LIYTLLKTPSFVHWAQAAPTRYRDRSHCRPPPHCSTSHASGISSNCQSSRLKTRAFHDLLRHPIGYPTTLSAVL